MISLNRLDGLSFYHMNDGPLNRCVMLKSQDRLYAYQGGWGEALQARKPQFCKSRDRKDRRMDHRAVSPKLDNRYIFHFGALGGADAESGKTSTSD